MISDEEASINAEADLREAIRDAYETAKRGDQTIYGYLEQRLVDAALCYFYKRSGNFEAALRDEIRKQKEQIEDLESSLDMWEHGGT